MRTLFALVLAALFMTESAAAQERISHQPANGRPYSAAVQVGDMFWFSGKIGATADTRAMTEGRAGAETRNIMEQFKTLLDELGMDFSNVVQGTVYLVDIDDYAGMNTVYGEYFPTDPPARETVAVSELVAGAVIEISFIAVKQ